MIEQILYHGTERTRGQRMIANKQMEKSRGDKHWLGDGSYFFEEDFFAYKWIYDMYNDRYKYEAENEEELSQYYDIIEGKLKVSSERIFNLDTIKHKLEFDRVYLECKKLKKHSKRFSVTDVPDGVILNIMFNEIAYDDDFDIVVCTFKQKSSKYVGTKMRVNFIPQKQVCVKKNSCIDSLKFFDYSDRVQEYHKMLAEYSKELEVNNSYIYSRSKRKMY